LAKAPEKRREKVCESKEGSCPEACGICAKESSPSVAPSTLPPLTGCHDNPDFRILINADTGRVEPCTWIDDPSQDIDEIKFRRDEQCFKSDINVACKRACGECCGDTSISFKYTNSETGERRDVDCAWLANAPEKRRKRVCLLKKSSCPEACGECARQREINGPDDDNVDDNVDDKIPVMGGAGAVKGTSQAKTLKVSLVYSLVIMALTIFW